ncbi:GFA family protein [Mongoliimonas terrestris]|uniref:GFA family protein n=1 Tax=Mongoliimonas terrestris TaxID=1709001 RepID=UPI00094952BE|nr:GFA family protein [Mongoliimonas terrestris]
MTAPPITGGCQCGAIRFRCDGVKSATLCHCRMCQKATGGLYGAFVNVDPERLTWTRGARKIFRSSTVALRGFCGDCGTPLTWEAGTEIAITIGSFDDPSAFKPVSQLEYESRVPFVDDLAGLPRRHNDDDPAIAAFMRSVVSHQHPDHDTPRWPLPPEDTR